jgi:HSP20 family protein
MIKERNPESPHVDVRCGQDGLQVDVDAAGVQDVIVRAEGHMLVIDGERQAPSKEPYLVHERVRTLHRVVELPNQADLHRLEASLTDGVLTIRAPLVHTRPSAELLLEVRPTAVCHPDAAPI